VAGGGNQTVVVLDKETKIQNLEKVFVDAGFSIAKPSAISVPVEFKEADTVYRLESDFSDSETTIRNFISRFAPEDGGRILEWQDDTKINFGVLQQVDGIAEIHYISIEVG
jgi:hypothetical protein